ncbi:protein RALF-like 19-like [Trifolium medium]|uniref:Protein RALF-like 19-like n=1 Tax=Trifolium medium TaxID=97028 RepID=A0A392NE41_9FABA|nr:protein RALF-like 19-like [Trifolium medium]
MESKRGIIILLFALTLALAMVTEAKIHSFSGIIPIANSDLIEDDNEFLMSSEENQRLLRGRRGFISYGALRNNQVPCGRRGRSYYNCNRRGRANPYRRGCTRITHCARDTS